MARRRGPQAACKARGDSLFAQAPDLCGGRAARRFARPRPVDCSPSRTLRSHPIQECCLDSADSCCSRRTGSAFPGGRRHAAKHTMSEPADKLSAGRYWTLPRRVLIVLVRGYRLLLSPWLGNACRFEPTCSVYAIGALERHGSVAGTALAVGRIARCHPWCAGGHDPVPARPPQPFRALLKRSRARSSSSSTGASDAASK